MPPGTWFLCFYKLSTLIKCSTFRIIPKTCGVASTSFAELVLFKPSALSVSFCRSGLSIGLLTSVIFTFFIIQCMIFMFAA